MTDAQLDIQELVKQSGVSRRTIYFYVQQGILPPPHGAGLSAYYTTEHLMRLKLIPLLRQQGLRLDEIRKRLEEMEKEEMEQLLVAVQVSPVPQKNGARKVIRPVPDLNNAPPASLYAVTQNIHYTLPDGITLVVPEGFSVKAQSKVERLLKAAAEIFMGDENGYNFEEKEK